MKSSFTIATRPCTLSQGTTSIPWELIRDPSSSRSESSLMTVSAHYGRSPWQKWPLTKLMLGPNQSQMPKRCALPHLIRQVQFVEHVSDCDAHPLLRPLPPRGNPTTHGVPLHTHRSFQHPLDPSDSTANTLTGADLAKKGLSGILVPDDAWSCETST